MEPDPTAGGGTVHIRESKTDQHGDGFTGYIGPDMLAAAGRYLEASGHTTRPLFRRVLRGGDSSAAPRAADASERSCASEGRR